MSGHKLLTYEQHKDIINRYYNNKTSLDISKVFNLHYNTVLKYVHNIPTLFQDTSDPNLNHKFFKNIDTDEKAYWLGFLLADGCVHNGRDRITITLNVIDEEHLDKFKEALNAGNHKFYYTKNGKYCRISIESKYLKEDLISHGVTPRKSLTAEFPIGIPDKLIPVVIRGIFDGDGCIKFNKATKSPNFSITGTYNVLTSIKTFMGINNKVAKIKDKKCYRLERSGKNVCKKFYDYIYKDATIWLSRKKEKFYNLA